MSFVQSGAFRRQLEAIVGPLPAQEEPDEPFEGFDDQLAHLSPEQAREVEALEALNRTMVLPELCGLRVGGFCTLPDQNGYDRDEVVEDFRGDEIRADAAMASLELFNSQGPPYVVLHREGVALLDEDPAGFLFLGCGLEELLGALVLAHRIYVADGPEAARAQLEPLFGQRTLHLVR